MNTFLFKKTIANNWQKIALFFIVSLPMTVFGQGFYISGTQLRDANGNNFIMKGINVPTSWFNGDVNGNIANIRNNTGSNCLRIVVNINNPDSYWQTSVINCIANNMIPMVELHDVTGGTNAGTLNNMAQFWASKAWFLTRSDISKYILINIANEWGDWNMANSNQVAWRNGYQTCITTIRNAGINTTLVIDAPGWGQDLRGGNALKLYASSLQNYDPRHNLLFSVHMYCEWASGGASNPATDIAGIRNLGIPLIVGEFGYQHDNSSGGVCDINEATIMNTCQNIGVGWLAWSWKGNGGGVEYLDLSNNWSGSTLSGWGNTVVWGSNGTKTASTCTVFNTNTPGAVSDGTYRITFVHSNLSLNVENASMADGGNVIQYGYSGGQNEQWFVRNLGNAQYSILNANSGRGLDVAEASTADGADINQWYYSGGNNQKWKIESVGSGYYRIVNANSAKCIDMPGNNTAPGTAVNQWGCNGGNNQSFTLTKLNSSTSALQSVTRPVPTPTKKTLKLTIYPNPSASGFAVRGVESFTYTLFNAAGTVVEKGNGRGTATLGNTLVSGIYTLEIKTKNLSEKFRLVKIAGSGLRL